MVCEWELAVNCVVLLSQGQEYSKIGTQTYITHFITGTKQMQFDLYFMRCRAKLKKKKAYSQNVYSVLHN